MFRPLPMKHVTIHLLTEELPLASLILSELQLFSPDFRPINIDSFPVIPGHHYREIYHQASSRLQKIEGHIVLSPNIDLGKVRVVSEEKLEETNDWLSEVWERCSTFEEMFHRLQDEEKMVDQLDLALDNFAELNIDLSLLQGEKLFLDIHVGMLPRENLNQLKEAVSLTNYLLFTYMEHADSSHIIIIGPKGKHESDIHLVLDTAGFRPLEIPPELHDEPDKVRQELKLRRELISKERKERALEMAECGNELRHMLEMARNTLIMAEPFVHMETAARSSGHLSVISGWIPACKIKLTDQMLTRGLNNPFQIKTRNPTIDENHLVPSYLPKGRLLSPFSTLVKQYGIPRYGEVDPTVIFAISFVVMFGMMFGDVGHGLTIAVVALLARKKLKTFTVFAICTGLSATLFGLLYGSVFGYEHLFHAVWIPPLTDPLYMLSVALVWGVGFLLLITLIAIHNRVVIGDISRAIFDTNGLVSIILYLAVLWGIFNYYKNGEFGTLALVVSLLGLVTLLAYKVIEIDAPPGERILVAVIETFETLTGYISNTLSFLRVAAFSLNHVALAIAVYTLADMMGTAGQWIMVIFGNLFILILEGAIVTIQALRLEYYEGFSRFFSGDGIEFRPLRLRLEVVK
ncbi:MAG: V-type ATP synthase subunit I [Gammaproteobacteria bacterium]|nr:V-type ATP synthase subunit I [Gammaproteobacteria bacterium]